MLIVALTGGIGSGKSTACAVLDGLGAHIVRLDDISRAVLAPGSPGAAHVAEAFPSVVQGGIIDRAALAELVFDDAKALERLEAIVHPRTWAEVDAILADIQASNPQSIAVVELALLAGSERQDWAHMNIALTADEDVRYSRLAKARGMSTGDIQARMHAQASDEEVASICDVVIDNSAGMEALELALTELWERRLVPYTRNLALSMRSTSALPIAPPAQARERALARLAWHGIEAQAKGEWAIALAERATAGAMAPAGFVPEGEGYASADPFSPVRAAWAGSGSL